MKPSLRQSYNLRGWFWILVTIALLALHFWANLSKVWHPQPPYNDWLPH